MARTAFIFALVLAWVAAGRVEAQAPGEAVSEVDPLDIPPEHDPLAHAWELPGQRGGFYLRLSTAIGVHNTRLGPAGWESDDVGATANGFGSGYGIDVGGFVRSWLALHLDANLGVLWNGDLDRDLAVEGQYGSSVRILAYGLAPAATFFSPHGFFFTPAFGVGLATLESRGEANTSDPGFYMNLTAGKELFVDEHFSFGLQFQILYMLLGAERREQEARVRQFLFGVSFGFDSQ